MTSPRKHRSLKHALGYTVVEVMMALAVLSIGATGVIAMQKTALIGNVRARNLAAATAVAASWIERLRVDGLRWMAVPGTNTSTIGATEYLQIVQDNFPTIDAAEKRWWPPPFGNGNALAGWEPAHDLRGAEEPFGLEQVFCPEYRVTQITPTVIRAEVRVYWLREQGGGQANPGNFLCPQNPGLTLDLDNDFRRENYHFVYMTTTIRQREPR